MLSQQWFDYIYDFDENGFAKVVLNGKLNFIDTNGNLLSKQWFNYITYFKNGIAIVRLNDKYNFIDTNGKVLSKQWFDSSDEVDDSLRNYKLQ